VMPLYRYNGQLLWRRQHGGLAIHERCCCDDCKCIGCDQCPDHCLTIVQLFLAWENCPCPYLVFEFPPLPAQAECIPDPACPSGKTCNDGVDNGKNCDWIENCKWRLYGSWFCMIDENTGAPEFSNCGTVIAEAISSTEWKFTVENGPTNCVTFAGDADQDCLDAVADPDGSVTLDVTAVTSPAVLTTICETPTSNVVFGPFASANQNAGSSPNGCFSEGDIEWTAALCCPDDSSGDGDGDGGGDGGGGGGSDPLGCCTNSDYTTTPDTTQADCEAGGGYWQQGDCDEGYP